MATDLPAIVVEAETPRATSTISALGAASNALRAYESHHGVHAVDAAPAPPPPLLPFDATEHAKRVAAIEATLHAARATLDLADATTTTALRSALSEVYGIARAHAEDPESPWLVAECLRMLARVELLAGDADDAAALRARARAIDGGRLLGLSEGTEGAPGAAESRVEVKVVLEGAPKGAIARIDGETHAADATFSVRLAPGEHHLRVVLAGKDGLEGGVLAASWIAIADAPTQTFTLRVAPPPLACTRADLAPAIDALATGKKAVFDVGCARWLWVERTADRSIEVRTCDAHACDEGTTWLAPMPTTTPPKTSQGDRQGSIWASPWTYVALGAGAAAVGSVVAWRLGAFDRPSPPPPTWKWEGIGAK